MSEDQFEPEIAAFLLDTSNHPFLFELPPEEGRRAVDRVQDSPVSMADVEIEDRSIDGGPTGRVSIRIVRPRATSAVLPPIVYIHGGGWIFGDAHTHDRLVREIAVGTGAAVIFVNYTPSPEAKYPTAIEQCLATVEWVAESGPAHGMDLAA